MTDAASAGGSGARQLITLAGVALAAGAATAAASYWLLRVSDQQQHGPGEAAAAQQLISSSQTQDTAGSQQHSQQQPAQRRRLAPQPLRSPFHNDKRCGGPGDPQSDDSMERCWEWLSQSEDGAPDVLGPLDSAVRSRVPAKQALRQHRQADQQQRQRQQQQPDSKHLQAGERRRSPPNPATRMPSATASDPLGVDRPPQRQRRSGSLPTLPPDLGAPSALEAASAPTPGQAADAGVSGTNASAALGVDPQEDSKARAVSWGPALKEQAQTAAPSGSGDLDGGPPTLQRQRTVAEALTAPTVRSESTRTPSSQSDGDQGTVALHELRLFHKPDGTPFVLGKGNFGTVYKAQFRGDLVAVKVFPVSDRPNGEESFRKEIALLRKCEHDHIVGFRAACLDAPGHLLMAMELMECDLRSALHEDKARQMLWYSRSGGSERTPGLAQRIALDIARGLQFLHERHIVHLDLKSPNVLLTEDSVAKIGDVGLARFMPNDYMSAQAAIGAFVWSAPEVLMGAKCSNKVDIYSFGVILWELVTGESPQRGRMRSIRVPEECPPGVADLVTACMERDASLRPSAAEIVELLAGDPGALAQRRQAQAGTDSVCGDEVEVSALNDERVRLQQRYNECNHCIYGGREAAVAAGYVEPPLDSVVEGIRPFDGKAYCHMIEELKELLQSPDIEDRDSAPRHRLEELMHAFRPLYALKLKMSWRVYQELRHTDIARLGELVDQLTAEQPDSAAGGSEPDEQGAEAAADAAQEARPAAAFPTAAAAEDTGRERDSGQAAPGSVRTRSKGSSRSTSTHASRQSGGSGDDGGYAANKGPARRAPPDQAVWKRVLEAMQLAPQQLEALAEARLRVGARLQHLQSERSTLVAKLQALSDPQDVEMYEQAAIAATELRANMRLEAQANHMFQVYLMMDLLQPIQYARAECCAWPAMFDAAEVGLLALERCRNSARPQEAPECP